MHSVLVFARSSSFIEGSQLLTVDCRYKYLPVPAPLLRFCSKCDLGVWTVNLSSTLVVDVQSFVSPKSSWPLRNGPMCFPRTEGKYVNVTTLRSAPASTYRWVLMFVLVGWAGVGWLELPTMATATEQRRGHRFFLAAWLQLL